MTAEALGSGRRPLTRVALTAVTTAVGGAAALAIAARAVTTALGDPKAPWLLGRAAGLTSYLLLVLLVVMGLVLAHPRRALLRRPGPLTRLRLHAGLAAFTLAFTVLHVVVLATDRYAGVGVAGSLVPMASSYRPLPVTLGVLGAWSGLVSGLTAALAGRLAGRFWWPVHRVAAAALALVWFHAVLAGSDAGPLRNLYVGTGAAVMLLAIWRETATRPGTQAP
ncbi:MAG TPA: hypothetical protein VMT69_05480 [Kineosporiaceae bacterium]|nr:hypothetical protein [Kineosporiaceae bacterium]